MDTNQISSVVNVTCAHLAMQGHSVCATNAGLAINQVSIDQFVNHVSLLLQELMDSATNVRTEPRQMIGKVHVNLALPHLLEEKVNANNVLMASSLILPRQNANNVH